MWTADLHLHTTFSDGKLTIPEIVDYFGARRLGAIAITDHLCEDETLIGKAAAYLGRTLTKATFPLYRKILESEANRAWREYRMLVLPGFELTRNSISNHRSSHIVAVGTTDWIDASGSVEDISGQIRAQGGLAIAAHPVFTRKTEKQTLYLWGNREKYAPCFDAWEVASGRVLFPEVRASGLPMIANSDFHRPGHFESWKTLFRCEKDFEAMKEAVRKQELEFQYTREGVRDGRVETGAARAGLVRDGFALDRNVAIPRAL